MLVAPVASILKIRGDFAFVCRGEAMKPSKLALCCVAAMVPAATWAEQSIFELSIEQLADIQVSVSSKVSLPLNLSPANISVFNQEQLQTLGVSQLAGLADVTSGYSSYSIYGERVLETRGQRAGSFENNKHLVLLDGIRLNHARANKAPIENELPLLPMKQVEVLRGPASAIYGQSAFFGVISLTSDSEGTDGLQLDGSYGGDEVGRRAMVSGRLSSRLGNSFGVYQAFDKGSEQALVGPDFSPLQRYYDDQQAHFGYVRHAFAPGNWGQFVVGYIDMQRQSGLGEHWVGDLSVPQNQIQWDTRIAYLSWQNTFFDDWQASVRLVNNDSDEAGTAINNTRAQIEAGDEPLFSQYSVEANARLLEAELQWQLGEQRSLLLGASLERRRDKGGFFVPDSPFEELAQTDTSAPEWQRQASDSVEYRGAFFQYHDVFPSLLDIHLTAGLRYDSGAYLQDSFSHWSPRVALVKALNERWTLKALYSSAFRSPGLKEYLLNDETRNYVGTHAADPAAALAGLSDSLAPETFSSTELDVLYLQSPWMLKLSGFYNQTDSALDGRPLKFIDDKGDELSKNSFANSAQRFEVYGVEAEFEWRFAADWQLGGALNQVWPASGSEAATKDMPKAKLLAFVAHDLSFARAQLGYRWHGDIEGDASAISSLDASLHGQWRTLGWHLRFKNLLGRDNFYAFDGEPGNPLPGRTVELGLSYRFD
jgi:outer membrane receptor for ferrienterochelin and colicins